MRWNQTFGWIAHIKTSLLWVFWNMYRVFFLWLASFKILLRLKFWSKLNQIVRNYSVIVLALYKDQLVHWFWVFWSEKWRYETYENDLFSLSKFHFGSWFEHFWMVVITRIPHFLIQGDTCVYAWMGSQVSLSCLVQSQWRKM